MPDRLFILFASTLLSLSTFCLWLTENLKGQLVEHALMKYSFKIASVWGIPIELHITFVLLMAVTSEGVAQAYEKAKTLR
jgi:hypothetical protein